MSDTVEQIRSAVGKPEASRRLHQKRTCSTAANGCDMEQFTAESRVYQSLTNKAVVLAGIQGCCAAAVSLALIRGVCGAHRSSSSSGSSGGSFPHSVADRHDRTLRQLAQSTLLTAVPTGLALAYTSCSGIYHERKFRDFERSREEWEMRNFIEGERDEMVQLYEGRGISRADAETIVAILIKDEKIFLDVMMMEELGYSRHPPPGASEALRKVGLPAAVAFILAVAVPHTPAAVFPTATACLPVGEVLLVAQSALLSVLQAKLLLGAYTELPGTLRLAACNAAWLTCCYGLTLTLKRLVCCTRASTPTTQ